MKDWSAEFRTVEEAQEAALASLDREHQKLTEVTNMIDQESTTVRSKDRSVSPRSRSTARKTGRGRPRS